jgi:hypothetical protein
LADASLPAQYDWLANVGLHSLNLLRFLLDADLVCNHGDS